MIFFTNGEKNRTHPRTSTILFGNRVLCNSPPYAVCSAPTIAYPFDFIAIKQLTMLYDFTSKNFNHFSEAILKMKRKVIIMSDSIIFSKHNQSNESPYLIDVKSFAFKCFKLSNAIPLTPNTSPVRDIPPRLADLVNKLPRIMRSLSVFWKSNKR